MIRLGRRRERGPIMNAHRWQSLQPQHRHQNRAAEQQHHLDIFSHHHRLQSAQQRVGDREQREHNDRGIHRHAEKTLEHLGRRKQADADMDEQRAEQADDRHEGPCRGTVTPLHELRQRLDPGIDVEGRKDQRQQNQSETRHPLEVADDNALLGPARREADEMNGRNVRGENRRAHREPTQRMAREKILLRAGVAAVANPDAKRSDADQVEGDDRHINLGNIHG